MAVNVPHCHMHMHRSEATKGKGMINLNSRVMVPDEGKGDAKGYMVLAVNNELRVLPVIGPIDPGLLICHHWVYIQPVYNSLAKIYSVTVSQIKVHGSGASEHRHCVA
jgi:hypothetical protein